MSVRVFLTSAATIPRRQLEKKSFASDNTKFEGLYYTRLGCTARAVRTTTDTSTRSSSTRGKLFRCVETLALIFVIVQAVAPVRLLAICKDGQH